MCLLCVVVSWRARALSAAAVRLFAFALHSATAHNARDHTHRRAGRCSRSSRCQTGRCRRGCRAAPAPVAGCCSFGMRGGAPRQARVSWAGRRHTQRGSTPNALTKHYSQAVAVEEDAAPVGPRFDAADRQPLLDPGGQARHRAQAPVELPKKIVLLSVSGRTRPAVALEASAQKESKPECLCVALASRHEQTFAAGATTTC